MEEQRRLLELERTAELEESRVLVSSVSLKELCERGVALQRLVISSQATGLYGRVVVTFTSRASGQRELPAHNISSGDILAVRTSGAPVAGEEVSGVVTSVTNSALSVAFSESEQELSLEESQLYSLVKLANDVTHRRLSKALDYLATNPSSAVLNLMFGVSSPSVPHQNLPPRLLNYDGDLAFYNSNLDQSQREAVEFCLKQRELGIVHGPPGTGKTTTVVEIIRQSVKAGDKVLVCAPSNVAVDNLVERLAKVKVKVVRLGHPARVNVNLQHHSLDAIISSSDEAALVRDIYRELDDTLARARKGDARRLRGEIKELRKEIRQREKKALREILGRAEVVLGTLTSAGPDSPLHHLPDKHFTLTVIDECSQALETACWIVAGTASKLVLSGDHLQLPPTILSSAASKGLSLTMMERMVGLHQSEVTRMLTIQYRMNSKIMQWSSQALYSGQLTAADCVKDHQLNQLVGVTDSPVTQTVLLLVDTAGCGMTELTTQENISKANEGEAAIVSHHVKELVEQGVNVTDMALVTPYNLQVDLLRLNLRPTYPNLEIKSVDGYQGREKEVVILSLVRSNNKKEVGFLGETRRLNVAVTRARRQLIVVCDTETVKQDNFLKEFIEYLEKEGEVRSADEYQNLPDMERPEGMVLNEERKMETNKKTQEKEKKTQSKPSKKTEPKKKVEKPVRASQPPPDRNFKPSDPQIQAEVDERKKEFEAIVDNFLAKGENTMDFSSDLNSSDRRLVHEIAESYSLHHESVGEGKERFIRISRDMKAESAKKVSGAKDLTKVKEEKELAVPSSSSKASSNAFVDCNACKKSVPKNNIELHKIRCVVPVDMKKEAPKAPKKKSSKKKQTAINEDEDFDSLCEQFQKLDTVCNFPKCKTLVATLGVTCPFCLLRFCLTHSMAEIHGCGEEARKSARQQMLREGKVTPGSGAVVHKPDREKRAQLSRKLDKKLTEKTDQRQRKKKE